MYAWALMVETYRRKPMIRLVHILFFIVYAGMILLSINKNDIPLERMMFLVVGVVLPLALSMGIFGNDIGSGRFRVLATEPISLGSFYVWRITGLMIQGALHMVFVIWVVLLLHAFTGQGKLEYLGLVIFTTIVVYATFVTLLTTLSVVAKTESNTLIVILLFLLYIAMYYTRRQLISPSWIWALDWGLTAGKYALPPVFLLDKFETWRGAIGVGLHSTGLIVVYALFGIILLHRKEFKPQRA